MKCMLIGGGIILAAIAGGVGVYLWIMLDIFRNTRY